MRLESIEPFLNRTKAIIVFLIVLIMLCLIFLIIFLIKLPVGLGELFILKCFSKNGLLS